MPRCRQIPRSHERVWEIAENVARGQAGLSAAQAEPRSLSWRPQSLLWRVEIVRGLIGRRRRYRGYRLRRARWNRLDENTEKQTLEERCA